MKPSADGYQSGFGNHFATEAIVGALPEGQNSPQKAPLGLYAEQLSGTSFCAARFENLRSWLYRIRPAACHGGFALVESAHWLSGKDLPQATPEQLRWGPLEDPKGRTDFVGGVVTYAVAGSPAEFRGCAAHLYAFNESMEKTFFYDADGELLFVPQQGQLSLETEMGTLQAQPGEIAVVPRGVKFRAKSNAKIAKGYLCENYGQPLRLPNLGPIGSNGLANPRDFLAPVAKYEDKSGDYRLVAKFQGAFWQAPMDHSALDVVAWHGNYAPYKYDLAKFNTIGTVSFDHPDPSIFTVLTSPSETPGTANVDFVIFPPRWMVAEKTFRPPYFHRNIMSEFMGLVKGVYDAKPTGFQVGGASLHNCMSGHGPDAESVERATLGDLKPTYLADTLAIMFESSRVFHPTQYALNCPQRHKDYLACWKDIPKTFSLR